MTGMTLTRGERRRISSMSISLRLKAEINGRGLETERGKLTNGRWEG